MSELMRVVWWVCFRENIDGMPHNDPHSFSIIQSCFNPLLTGLRRPSPRRRLRSSRESARTTHNLVYPPDPFPAQIASTATYPHRGRPRLADLDTCNHFRRRTTPLRIGHSVHVLWYSGTRLSRVSTQGAQHPSQHPSRSLGETPPTSESKTMTGRPRE